MSKLNIQTISAYLPYQIKCLVDNKHKAELMAVYFDGTCCFTDLVESEKGFESIKPFLRPISEADTIIRTEFAKFHKSESYDCHVINLFCEDNIGNSDLIQDLELYHLPYECIQWLLARHFDVFGLLDSGDAVLLA
jgi:hypothetical protein